MAKKTEKSNEKSEGKKSSRKLYEAAREHQDALQSAGLHGAVIDKLENALKGLEGKKELTVSVDTLQKDIQRAIGEFQGAMRKEFPNNASFQSFFKAGEPMPTSAHGILALGRELAKTAPDFSANLIKYAINAASVKHLTFLCDELEKEIGGADPAKDAAEAEETIREAARRAFEGKPELAAFAK